MVKHLATELDKASQSSEESRLKTEELKLSKQKQTKKINEVSIFKTKRCLISELSEGKN